MSKLVGRSRRATLAALGTATVVLAALSWGAISASALGDPAAGRAVFATNGCGGCHTLAAAGAKGTSGTNFDTEKPSADEIAAVVTSGKGAMPAYGGKLTPDQIQNLAAYIASVEGKAPAKKKCKKGKVLKKGKCVKKKKKR